MNKPDPTTFVLEPEVSRLLDRISAFGSPLITGGAIRDWLLGKLGKDLDVEVFGCDWDTLLHLLKPFGKVDLVGKSFAVAKLRLSDQEIDFSLPRSEVKMGDGHRGFEVKPDPRMDPRCAALRRDFTLNSISFDWKSRTIIDPLNGSEDLAAGILRHSSPAFVEDPLRVLRGFQFCARFELLPAKETVDLCRKIKGAMRELPGERVWMEWEKWATRSIRPSLGLKFLQEVDWLDHFPEVAALVDCPQDPTWHPEGNVFVHTCHCLDALAKSGHFQKSDRMDRMTLMFAVLAHDFGKPGTTELKLKGGKPRWVSPGHDQAGILLAENFLHSIGAPHGLIPRVQALVGSHMASIHINKRPSLPHVRRLARKLAPATLEQLFTVIRSDIAGRPPLSPDPNPGLLWLEEVAQEEALNASAPKPLVYGRHLIERGYQPGPHFKKVLEALFELQLDGAFSTLEEAEPFIARLCKRHTN